MNINPSRWTTILRVKRYAPLGCLIVAICVVPFLQVSAASLFARIWPAIAFDRPGSSMQPNTSSRDGGAPSHPAAGNGPEIKRTLTERATPRTMSTSFRGDQYLAGALRAGQARATALEAADLDGNATPDVVAGYALNGAGAITVQRGNPEAFAPKDESVYARMQRGYHPDSLLPEADVIPVPESPDFIQLGDFNLDRRLDIVTAARGGDLYLLAGDGTGAFAAPERISLPGTVTAMRAGEFRAPDGRKELAVAINGPAGPELRIFDGVTGVTGEALTFKLRAPGTGVQFAQLDSSPFISVAVAAGDEVEVIHGWGRKTPVSLASRVERIPVDGSALDLATGFFVWNRAANTQIAVLMNDGAVRILTPAGADERRFTPDEITARARMRLQARKDSVDIETLAPWQAGKSATWTTAREYPANGSFKTGAGNGGVFLRSHLSYGETDDLVLSGLAEGQLTVVGQFDSQTGKSASTDSTSSELAATGLAIGNEPVAVLALPQKLNGERSVLVLKADSTDITDIVLAPTATITVDRTDDPSGGSLAAASVCAAAANDCSLRGSVQFANANPGTVINLGANTYTLNTNGTGGCVTENAITGNTIGDLEANETTTFTGISQASTIINQIGTGNVAHPGDRVLCMDVPLTGGKTWTFSAMTIVGGRDVSSNNGGGGFLGGAKATTLNLTNVTFVNNQTSGASFGGGGAVITGGDMNVTNCTFGAANAPGASRTDLTLANAANTTSGGGFGYTSGDPGGTNGALGTLTLTGTTFTHNTTSSGGSGGGGLDIFGLNLSAPTVNVTNCTFSNNQATGSASGGGVINEGGNVNLATSSITNNSAGNRGGGVYAGGGSTTLDGTVASLNITGNTAVSGGSSVSAAAPVILTGSNTTVGGTIEVTTNGTWTNTNTGSSFNPTDIVVNGGTFNCNNSTMNLSGDLSISHEATHGGIFNANSGTINIAGDLSVDLTTGGSGAVGQFNAGTGLFNFNGTTTQSINGPSLFSFNNLTDSNTTQPLTANIGFAVNGTLSVNGAAAIFDPVAAAIISGSGTLTGTGTARVRRTAATADFLSQYTITTKTLTNLTIDYDGAGAQTVNSLTYGGLSTSNSGTKTLGGAVSVGKNLSIGIGTTLDVSASNFALNVAGNWANSGTFTPRSGTVTFNGSSGTQTLTGTTTFFDLTLNNTSATTDFGSTSTTISHTFTGTAGAMSGGTSTLIFTGNPGSITGPAAKNFNNLTINAGATVANSSGGNLNIANDFTNNATFSQSAGLMTTFVTGADGNHSILGTPAATTFGNFSINSGNTVDAGSHNFNVLGASFDVAGTFTGNTDTVTFNGGSAQAISNNGTKNFAGLTVNNANGVTVNNGTGTVDASVSGTLTLTTDLTVASGAILQQNGGSSGAGDVIGTVRRTDLGGTAKVFGNSNNAITINSGTAPNPMDVSLVKSAPVGFPTTTVVPRTYTLSPTGGSGISATVQLRYLNPAELAGITEASLILWKKIGATWTPQGGTVNAAGNFVSKAGVTSFSDWAIAQGPDLTITKGNNVGGSTTPGTPWTWTVTVSNPAGAGGPAVNFTVGQTVISDNLPNSANINYGSPLSSDPNITCAIDGNKDLTCTAGASGASIANAGSFNVQFTATATAPGTYLNPRAGGNCTVDPGQVVGEFNEGNNTATDSVTVVAPDLTSAKTNNVSGTRALNSPWTWTITVNNIGGVNAVFSAGQVVFRDNLPNTNVTYDTPTTAANATCVIDGSFDLTCTANAGGLTVAAAGSFSLTIPVTGASVAGAYVNPRAGGSCAVDPDSLVAESNDANNTCSNTVNVFAPPTVVKSFNPTAVSLNGISTLSIQITNPAANPAQLSGIGFTDTFPAGLQVTAAPTLNNNCSGGTFIANGNATTISLAGAMLNPGVTCTVSATVTPTTNGAKVNNVTVNSTQGGASALATATLSVGRGAPLDFDGDGTTDYAVVRDSGAPRPSGLDGGTIDGVGETADSQQPALDATGRGAGPQRGYYFKLPGERFDPLEPHIARPETAQVNQMRWVINTSGPGADINVLFGTLNDFPLAADFDGDGICDLAVWTGGVGAQFKVLTSASGFVTTVTYTLGNGASDPSVVGDYDGDGKADPAVVDRNTGQWTYLGGATHTVSTTVTPVGTFGGGFPAPGDYDGDGKFDFMLETRDGVNPTMGHFYQWLNTGSLTPPATANFAFGNYRDSVIPGDYDGDGKTDLALASLIVNPIAWRIRLANAGTLQGPFTLGNPAIDYTINGDYNGDQKAEITIFHPPATTQFQSLLAPAFTTLLNASFGQAGDYPVAYFNSH